MRLERPIASFVKDGRTAVLTLTENPINPRCAATSTARFVENLSHK
jgi:hypothetical protein